MGEQVACHLKAEHVVLTLDRAEHHTLARTPSRDAKRFALKSEHTQADVGGDVLVGDRQFIGLPEVTDLVHAGGDHLRGDHLLREPRIHCVAHDALGLGGVPGQQRGRVGARQRADERPPSPYFFRGVPRPGQFPHPL